MENKPLVSVITVCYNSKKYIKNTIESVLMQTYKNLEYIIIDGESTDGTIDIIKKFETRFNGRMKLISEKDKGIYDAMNKGIKLAEGKIIGIINSDDWYEPYTIGKVMEKFSKTFAEVVYGDIYIIDIITNSRRLSIGKIYKGIKNAEIKINHPTIFIKKSVYKKYGVFNTKLDINADKDLVLRFLRKGVIFEKINLVLANFRLGGASSKHNLKFCLKRLQQEYQLLTQNNVGFFVKLKIVINLFYVLFRNWLIVNIFSEKVLSYLKLIRHKKYYEKNN